MTKKQKIVIVSIFIFVLIVVTGLAAFLNKPEIQEGEKEFQIEIISQRDDYYEIFYDNSGLEFLGDYLRTVDGCEWIEAEYGMYITGFNGMEQDLDNQYWWCITVNDKEIPYGTDDIVLMDGNKYTFTLMQGW